MVQWGVVLSYNEVAELPGLDVVEEIVYYYSKQTF